ncbi:DUF998 domain-containing protein [Actinopolymorpha alba]|uniref:DUF998 domain-containing protein n=1 Tax=Actinopolymorpha alba TaxID=533267 RepID=UPI000688CE57|nr:DUF998 domain-containing protein [Actinopolymorpha alba]
MADTQTELGCDRGAAVTRSMLGWGVVAGPFYLLFGITLALTRPGFDLTRDALSLLLIGDLGWLQWLNLVLSGLMSIVAAIGLLRTPEWSRAAGLLVGVYGACFVLSAIFPPDATENFPPGAGGGEFTTAGILHFVFGGVGFVGVGIAAIIAGSWLGRRQSRGTTWSRVAGVVIIVAFLAGGALSALPGGVGLLWITVLVAWGWLAMTSIAAYRAIPHPAIARR